MINKEQIAQLGLIVGPVLFAITLYSPIDDISFEAKVVLGSAIWMGVWWVTEAIPIYVTALLPLAIFPSLNVAQLGETSMLYADRIVFLFLGGFMLAMAIEKAGLHKRFALNVLKVFGTNPKHIVGAFMVVTGSLSAWMSNTATTMLMLPIAAAVIAQVHSPEERGRFGTCLMLCVAYSASLGGMATLIGTPPNAIFASLSKKLINVDVSFGQWMLIGIPVSAISLVVAWWYMVNLGAKIGSTPITEEKGIVIKKLIELGNMTRDEKMVAGVFVATATAWITRGLIWKDFLPFVDDSTIAVIAAICLFLIPSVSRGRLLDWESVVRIPWGVLLLIGGGLALASGFTITGLDVWIADQLKFLGGMHYFLIILIIVAVIIFAGEILSNTATAALFIPIVASLAVSLEISPLLLMLPITLATAFGFIMPVGTPPNAIVFASGHVTAGKMAKAGFPLDIIGIVLVSVLATLLVPLVWG
ncbi:MAG: SLC13 family permease [Nitrososphaerales archaeon]